MTAVVGVARPQRATQRALGAVTGDEPNVPRRGVAAGVGGGRRFGSDPAVGWGLVEAAQRGDRRAFGELYERYVDAVFRYVLCRVGDRSLAEDITSETFLRALRGIDSLTYQGRDVGAWLVTIARNLIVDHRRSSRYRLDSVVAQVPDSGVRTGGLEDEVIGREVTAEVLGAVAGLDRAQRDCIVLRFWGGLSVTETAAVLERTPAAVKGLQHRAVRRLAHLLPALATEGGVW